jgi:two-component system sensor histidine kinase MprB
MALLCAAAVTVGIASVSAVAWWATARSMRGQVDEALTSGPRSTSLMQARGEGLPTSAFDPEQLCRSIDRLTQLLQPEAGSIQLVRADGTTCGQSAGNLVPVTAADRAAANGGPGTAARDDTTRDGTHVRVVTAPLGNGFAITIARDLTEIDTTLRTLTWSLLLATGLGAAGALTVGLMIARAGLRPVNELTRAAEHVAATQDFDVPISVTGNDEVARLAMSFNKMTAALAAARDRQQQLVADASHELRTPLTSLRTNIELLVRSEDTSRPLAASDRRELIHSLSAQLQELSQLSSELTMLAHDGPVIEPVPVPLADVVHRAVERASRRGAHRISTDLQPWTVSGSPGALERAVLNLLDNAVKFSPPNSTVRVRLREGLLEVSDEGPGIPEADRAQVFQRFWRSPSARALPGSGLGLAIVADVVAGHGGRVGVDPSPTGGAVLSFWLPGVN